METKQIITTFMQIINWAGERNKVSREYGTNQQLYIAEIHAIEIIGENPGILQRELCEIMGITKGRVSIIISNLEKKGLLTKVSEGSNKKELPIQLTDMGKVAFEGHSKREQEFMYKINEVLGRCNQEEMDKFNNMLADILEILKQ